MSRHYTQSSGTKPCTHSREIVAVANISDLHEHLHQVVCGGEWTTRHVWVVGWGCMHEGCKLWCMGDTGENWTHSMVRDGLRDAITTEYHVIWAQARVWGTRLVVHHEIAWTFFTFRITVQAWSWNGVLATTLLWIIWWIDFLISVWLPIHHYLILSHSLMESIIHSFAYSFICILLHAFTYRNRIRSFTHSVIGRTYKRYSPPGLECSSYSLQYWATEPLYLRMGYVVGMLRGW